jgi:hemolysin activation/secretion protein
MRIDIKILIVMILTGICFFVAPFSPFPVAKAETFRQKTGFDREPDYQTVDPSPSHPPEGVAEILPPPSRAFRLPDLPPPAGGEPVMPSASAVFVKRFHLLGNTVFSKARISEITTPFEDRKISNEELEEVRHRLTLLYVNQGYINSGVIIPDQKISGGVVTLRAIEGHLNHIDISGNRRLRDAYLRNRIARVAGPPLSIHALQEQLQLLDSDPLIRRIQGALGPGSRPGESELEVTVTEEPPYRVEIEANNARSAGVGGESLKVRLAHMNISGRGDAVGLIYDLTEGLDDLTGYYRIPLNARDTTLELKCDYTEALITEEPFDAVDITSRSLSYGLTLSHPIVKRPGEELILSLTTEKRHSETFVLGLPFSFAPGVQNGESDVTVIRFAQNWIRRRSHQVVAARSVFSLGIDALDATLNASDPDGQFLIWLGQFQYARRIPRFMGSQMIFRTDLQLAAESLLPIEKFPVGGATSVRGYRENQLIRDNGATASLEWRIPVFRLPLPKISKTPEDGTLQLATFADIGWGWNTDLPTPDVKNIASAGIGLRWDPSSKMHAEIYWGLPLKKVNNPHNDLQDSGIHFKVNWRLF